MLSAFPSPWGRGPGEGEFTVAKRLTAHHSSIPTFQDSITPMKLFGFNLNLLSRNQTTKPPARKSLSPEMNAWLMGEYSEQATSTLTNAYQQVVWVYRAVNVLAEQVANIPFLFSAGDRGRENLITAGPLTAFYNRPAPNMNRFQYWELRVMYL